MVIKGKGRIWFKGNKVAEKWTPEAIIKAFSAVLDHIINHKDGKTFIYIGEVDLFLIEKYGIVPSTRSEFINNIHKDNKCIVGLWNYILQVIENRVVKDNEQLRPAIQAMVLQNKHNYREKHDVNHGGQKDNPIKVDVDYDNMTAEDIARLIQEEMKDG